MPHFSASRHIEVLLHLLEIGLGELAQALRQHAALEPGRRQAVEADWWLFGAPGGRVQPPASA